MIKNDFRQVHIRLSEKTYKELKVKCVYEDLSIQEYLTKLITDNLGTYSKEGLDVASISD